MTLIIKELKELLLKGEAVSISRNSWDQELTGHLCKVTDHVIAMHLYTDEGRYDGFSVFPVTQITEIFWGNREHQAINHLIAKNGHVKTPSFESTQFEDIVLELDHKHSSTAFYYGGDEDQFELGKIITHDETWLKVKTFAIKRTLSPKFIIFQRDEITRIDVNSPYQDNLVELHGLGL